MKTEDSKKKVTYPDTLYPSGQFPLAEAEDIKGGLHSVEKYSDIASIIKTNKLTEDGMLVFVRDSETISGTTYKGQTYYKYDAIKDEWGELNLSGISNVPDGTSLPETAKTGDLVYIDDPGVYEYYNGSSWEMLSPGLPIYNGTMYQALKTANALPEEYITVADADDLAATTTTTSYSDVGNGTYLDILFKSLRALQSEVAKMKNSFDYGLYSYTEDETAMSRVLATNEAGTEEEPLWATQEEDLSELEGCYLLLSKQHSLTPKENVSVGTDLLTVTGTASWNDDEDLGYASINDAKLYLFMTTSSLDIQITLTSCKNSEDQKVIDLSKCGFANSTSGKYNILFVLSRSMEYQEKYYGNNFAWLSVADYATLTSQDGYWSTGDKLKNNLSILGSADDLEAGRYYISKIDFSDLTIYKFNCYSKYQDFTNTVEPVNPTDDDYKYRVAHITIRSVKSKEILNKIKDQLPKNELIYNEGDGFLYIKTDTSVKKVSGSSSSEDEDTDSGMEKSEIITWLAKNGIVVTENGTDKLKLNNIGDITFIHQATGKSFKFEVDSEGNLKSTELSDVTLVDRMEAVDFELSTETSNLTNVRGFVGTLGLAEQHSENPNNQIAEKKDIGLYSDRIKIGAVYCPYSEAQTTFGCSHAFIELENTSNKDFPLEGCYLHWATGTCTTDSSGSDEISEYSLALTGTIPAGGTYLIRGKQYTDFDQSNCFIKVRSFDQEWYVDGELIDLTLHNNNAFMLTYGLPGKDLDVTSTFSYQTVMFGRSTVDTTNAPWSYHPNFIDSLSIGAVITYKTGETWSLNGSGEMVYMTTPTTSTGLKRDCIYRNTFELDPAKQAFQACNLYDSSRKRHQSTDDYQYLILENEYITFPKTSEKRAVDFYTPKASYENKNVCTDKSKLDMNKPNMVTCSFGLNMHTTRCFNWISAGYFDEYVWIRKKGDTAWSARFESYKPTTMNDAAGTSGFTKKTFGTFENKTTGTTDTIQSVIYDRMTGHFPGDGTYYTSHKCIVDLLSEAPTSGSPTVYEYVVGRADINSKPDSEHISSIKTFTIYPTSFTPRLFQTTDQQGFHWVEYQCWAGAAKELNKTINEAIGCTFESDGYTVSEYDYSGKIIPVLLNTGDMTQNGTRINEWLDYYNAGDCLFEHLEQMNVVGNNDLCNSIDETDADGNVTTISYERLGTGDDPGKSNAYYFHVFYCYEIDPDIVPIISNTNATHYIPSLYYFENEANSTASVSAYRFVMINTEITATTCLKWFKQLTSDGTTAINVYTGWPITAASDAVYDSSFTTVYTMIYDIFNGAGSKNIIAACHEMPFTVITNANLVINKSMEDIDRSLKESKSGSLVGCHGNRLNSTDTHAIYWLSRLLEHFKIKLMLGGHKHTYACTNPLREFYYYTKDGTTTNSLASGPMTMERTLANDTAVWETIVGTTDTASTNEAGTDTTTYNYTLEKSSTSPMTINTTKFPLMKSTTTGITKTSALYYPYYGVSSLTGGVVYFMCQATGFKLKSNKELPSPDQRFAYVIPKTKVAATKDTPNVDQQRPMFAEISLSGSTYSVYLYRVEEIMKSTVTDGKVTATKLFNQITYSTKAASYNYLTGSSTIYGSWGTTKTPLITI